jgi:ferredoxin
VTFEGLERDARLRGLTIVGGFHPEEPDQAPQNTGTLLLLGPDEPAFWPVFTASAEYGDGQPDPLDRWSKRVVGHWIDKIGGAALFPSDGPPYPPFISWALKTGTIRVSPVGLLVHTQAGLFISFRAAVALPDKIRLPETPPDPCVDCARPCLSACPVGALGASGYDVALCKSCLDSPPGKTCMDAGCLARRSCPVSQEFGRMPQQSAFHMKAFNPQ